MKKFRRRNDPGQKNSEENLEKDSPHVLFVFAWYEGLHCIRHEIVVQLVNMEKGFVWFPTIACLSKTCPTDSEFHSGALVSVTPVAVDCFYHKFLFIMMGDLQRYCPRWVIVERCDTAVRTQYVLPVTSPVSLLTQTSFHHTFCTVHTVHTVCSPSLL